LNFPFYRRTACTAIPNGTQIYGFNPIRQKQSASLFIPSQIPFPLQFRTRHKHTLPPKDPNAQINPIPIPGAPNPISPNPIPRHPTSQCGSHPARQVNPGSNPPCAPATHPNPRNHHPTPPTLAQYVASSSFLMAHHHPIFAQHQYPPAL